MMSDQTSDRLLRWAAVAFAIGFAVHGLDHLRRGMSASPPAVMVGGTVQGVFVVAAVAMVLRRHPLAPRLAAFVGFGSALLFTYAHLLPTFWPAFQDSFISLPHINVMWFSWFSAVAEIGTGIVVGGAGIRAARGSRLAGMPAFCDLAGPSSGLSRL
ncbi:hypothetical protein A5694_07940 [Mycolicibacter sinensis]|nr:hypothetical protein A5694_07940 [Mycolicibacter sinensis]